MSKKKTRKRTAVAKTVRPPGITSKEMLKLQGIAEALEFLEREARLNQFCEVEQILKATHRLCWSHYWLLVSGNLIEKKTLN